MSQTAHIDDCRIGYNQSFVRRLNERRAAERLAEQRRIAELHRQEPGRQLLIEQKAEEARQRQISARRIAQEIRAENDKLVEIARAKEIEMACKRARTSYARIEARACRVFNVTRKEIRSESRAQRIVIPRQFIAYWARRLTDHSFPYIGRMLGGNDHTTVLSSVRVYPKKRAKNGRFLRSLREAGMSTDWVLTPRKIGDQP